MTKKYDSQRTIETILESSARLFLEKGFDKISVQEIANQAKISKGAIYHHFSSKEEILNAVMDMQVSDIENKLKTWIIEAGDVTSREKLIYALKKNIEEHEKFSFEEIKNFAKNSKSADYIVAYMRISTGRSAEMLSEVIREGNEDLSLNTAFPDECAEVFLFLINIWCDPFIFKSDLSKVLKKLEFLKHTMNLLGVDILDEEIIFKMKVFFEKFYS